MDPVGTNRRLFSIESAADQLAVGRTMIYELVKKKQLSKVKIGTRGLITSDSINAYIDRLVSETGSGHTGAPDTFNDADQVTIDHPQEGTIPDSAFADGEGSMPDTIADTLARSEPLPTGGDQ